jgi:hypothetical protein
MHKGEESIFECDQIRFISKADNTSVKQMSVE